MLYIDSAGQIRVGLSERISKNRFKKVIYKQKVPAQICLILGTLWGTKKRVVCT